MMPLMDKVNSRGAPVVRRDSIASALNTAHRPFHLSIFRLFRLMKQVPQIICTKCWLLLVCLALAPSVNGQNGVRGNYFTNQYFIGTPVVRDDAAINFDWGSGSPVSGVPVDHFSVRWSGEVEPLYDDIYTFYAGSDDGARLWVNGKRLISNWQAHMVTTNSSSVILRAGQRYLVQMDFYDQTAGAIASLAWSSPHQSYQIIPNARWFLPIAGSNRPPNTPLILAPFSDGTTVAATDFAMHTDFMSDPDPGDTHICSDWEIWTVSPSERIWSAPSSTNLVKVHLSNGTFENSYAGRWCLRLRTNYKLRVRHKDSSGVAATEWSDWSERLFNTSQPLTTLVSQGSVWKYSDIGATPGTDWMGTNFNDSSWASGAAQLGVGDNDETTVTCCSSGPRVTTYFRLKFMVTNVMFLTNPVVRLLRDDGGVVYLNGVEIDRDNMPTGTISYSTLAPQTASEEAELSLFYPASFPMARLHNGTNTLAVEIHQNTTGSTDLSFDLELIASIIEQKPVLQCTRTSASCMTISWTDPDAVLEEASNVLGPWQEVVGQVNPCLICDLPISVFFRLNRR